MLKNIKGSLAYRLPKLYRKLLKLKKIKIGANKERSGQIVLMMTGKNHIDMSRLAILSIANTWYTLPHIIISSDGTISTAAIKKKLAFWPGELTIHNWKETAEYHLAKQRCALINFANAHHFGKKLAVILHHAAQYPLIWVDSDILFFKDFTRFIPNDIEGFACGGSEDITSAYHEAVLKEFKNNLYDVYSFNAGILLVSGKSIYEDFHLEDVLQEIHPGYDFCTEQTIFGQIASKSLGIIWTRDIIANFNDDNQSIKPMPVNNVIARHYTTNVRHLFWRDAFFHL